MRWSIVSRYPKLDYKYIEVIENISEIDRFQNGYDENMSILSDFAVLRQTCDWFWRFSITHLAYGCIDC